MKIDKIHHVAYRCKDAKETVDWYVKHLNMKFVLAIAEDQVPSTHAPDPYMHLFLDAGGGNILAFFEIPNSPPMGRDTNTPDWVQHLALEVGQADGVGIDQAKTPDPGRGQIEAGRGAQPAGADQQHPGLLQRLLARSADFAQHQMARVAFDLFVREAHAP